ncbi:MAG TPA: PIG-L family deacetylase [Gemmatimonadaceae bacterium]|nr:PIG-L family deacetylase [Gemmatimonadaceae bacterium]
MKRALIFICSLFVVAAPRLSAQERGAAALGEAVEGLGTTARVLVIGAHPDDEDTRLIAWLAKGRHVQTAYLSLTRGDGGQNLIGNELGPELGMIRTEELLAARRIDGGHQYFTRAYDFGFTKTLSETMGLWPRDSILKDMVAIVRAYRPQVIVSVWSGTPADGHGQHQYAGVLARDVYAAAADSVRFPPSKLGGLPAWATPKFYQARGFRGGPTSVQFDVGEYDPLLGETYAQIATISRSQHRSQSQGGLPQFGPAIDGVLLQQSRVSDPKAPEHTMFDGLDTSWARFKNVQLANAARGALDSLAAAQAAVTAVLDLAHPARMVAPLAAYLRLVERAQSGVTCTTGQAEHGQTPCAPEMGDLALALRTTHDRAVDALLDAAGVHILATAPRELVAESDTLPVTVSVYDEGSAPVELTGVQVAGSGAAESELQQTIAPGGSASATQTYRAPNAPTMSWWLRHPLNGDTFDFGNTDDSVPTPLVVGEDRLRSSAVDVRLSIDGTPFTATVGPIVHRYADRAIGEVDRPIATVPAITVLLQHEIEYARANHPFDRTYVVHVQSAATAPRDVSVSLALPRGLTADSAVRRVGLDPFGTSDVYFHVRGMLAPGRDSITAVATSDGQRFTQGYVPIEYSHIRPLRYYRPSTVRIESVNANYAHLDVGYIRGVGDNEPPMLEELGIPVTELDPATIAQTNLARFTTIVIGPRAHEANPSLVANNGVLMRFARNGGTIVTQYGQFPYVQLHVLPYPFTLTNPADRVTYEDAPVRVIDPGSPLLATPNKITEADFANWVQERSSYMPHTFDPHYRAVFSLNDPGESPNDAAVLIAPVGKGTYVYTTFSFFRQLPAGNPGAARLFVNLLSADHRAATRPPVASAGVKP